MLRAILRCLATLARTGEAISGFALFVVGKVVEVSSGADIPLWAWLSGATVLLFVMAVRLQMQVDDKPHLRKLKTKPYLTFGEIGDAISKDDLAYSQDDILDRLLHAALSGEFKSPSGHSRLRITGFDSLYAPTLTRPIFRFEDLNAFHASDGVKPTAGVVAYERSIYKSAITDKGPASAANVWLILERADFLRWYRRFRNGKYEQ